jgi:hypothetical protein
VATVVLTVGLRTEDDLSIARRRARDLAALLQLPPRAQIAVSKAVWQVARHVERRGRVEFAVEAQPSAAAVLTVWGVSGVALPISGDAPRLDLDTVRPLVDRVDARDVDGAVVVQLVALVAPEAWMPNTDDLRIVLESLTRDDLYRRRKLRPSAW